ncbi:hypothetical protein Micbo1qcDRAFT_176325 [Microdochium bolleyi]|uniref:Uncharacterized protein n=1 Tax=Microdochium bolleyi TaxID=196109 RepID=A0A136J026_9PEZI|nr:hypothetical protein Micbo1qcDRAFT_176325 [Microdochium bolleyi]
MTRLHKRAIVQRAHSVAIKDGQYQYAALMIGPMAWDVEWTPLGLPQGCQHLSIHDLGFPIVVAWGKAEAEVIALAQWTTFGAGLEQFNHRTSTGERTLFAAAEDSGNTYQITCYNPAYLDVVEEGEEAGSNIFSWANWRSAGFGKVHWDW